MSFLTSEEAGLGQPWYDESNVVSGIGGLLSMSELTSLKNYYKEPPMFPASVGLNGLGLPVSDLVPGELESGKTLVDTTSVGNVRRKRNQSWHGRRRRRGHGHGHSKCEAAHTRTQVQAGVAASGTAPTTVASEGAVLAGLGMSGSPVPVRDLVPGELDHASQMISLPQAFGSMGAGSPVPRADFVRGEITHASKMISLPQAFGSMGAGSPVPRADFVRGEIVSGGTLVDHAQSFGGLGMYHGQYGKDLFVPATPGVPGATGASRSHAAKMLSLPQAGRALPVADLVPGELTSARSLTAPSHVSKMLSLPQASRALPVRDLAPGELTHAAKMTSLPQAFGGLGAGSPVPISDFVRGEITPGSRLAAHRQGFGDYDVPVSDLVPGEYVTGGTLVDHAQGFGSYHGQYGGPVEDRALPTGERTSVRSHASKMLSLPQASRALPVADLVPGELTSARSLTAVPHVARMLSLPQARRALPVQDLAPGELTHASKMTSLPQAFGGMGDFIPWQPGSVEPRGEAQGSFLSPNQVPAWDLESGDSLASQPQNFGGLGAGKAVPRGDFVESEIESSSRMLKHGQRFGGLGAFLPFEAGMPEPKDGAQGTWLSPSQVPAWDRESAQALISSPESFGGMGAGGANVALPELNLAPVCDPQTGACISYATPQEIRSAIGAKIGGKSALVQGQAKLPAFYDHPNLGPWGVDPRQAYQYWWAQQANMQRAGAEAPIPIWGSPGFVAPTPELPPSPIAQEASFNPYTNAYPVAGTSVERF